MPLLIRELSTLSLLVALGVTYSLLTGPAPRPWAQATPPAGAIRAADAAVLNVLWIDVRSRRAYATGHIPGAVSDPSDGSESGRFEWMEAWLAAPRPIIVYCADAGCDQSRQQAERLRSDLPNAEIYYLEGGWAAWQAYATTSD